jgi:predicted secreted protein
VKPGSALAIYFLFFTFTAFLLLPFGVKTDEEVGVTPEKGHAESAPHRFDLKRHLIRSAIVSAVLLALFLANYQFGWITADDIDFYDR